MDTTALLPDLLTRDQVAQKLNIAPQTLANWQSTGRYADQLPAVRIGGLIRYRAADVERVVQEGITPRTADAA